MSKTNKNSANGKSTNWDNIFKGISAFVAVAGLAFGVYQYHENSKNAAKATALELNSKRLQLFLSFSGLARSFAEESDRNTAQSNRSELLKLLGEIQLVGNAQIEPPRKNFCEALKRWDDVNAPPADFWAPKDFSFRLEDPNPRAITFRELAESLTRAMQQAMQATGDFHQNQALARGVGQPVWISDQAPAQHIQRRLRSAPTDQLAIAWKF